MDERTRIDNAKLIAEFMGYFVQTRMISSRASVWVKYPTDTDFKRLSTLKYHLSFDWIMPVVDRIESLGYNFRINSYHNDKKRVHCNFYNSMVDILSDNVSFENKQDAIYFTVVSFIKNYKK